MAWSFLAASSRSADAALAVDALRLMGLRARLRRRWRGRGRGRYGEQPAERPVKRLCEIGREFEERQDEEAEAIGDARRYPLDQHRRQGEEDQAPTRSRGPDSAPRDRRR